MNRKPSGIIASAVILGFATFFLFAGAVLFVIMAIAFGNHPELLPPTPGATAAPAGLLTGIFLFFALVFLAFTAWGTATIVGILRLKSWARISIMVIGGGIVLISLLSILGSLASQAMLPSMPANPNASPAMLRVGFAVISVFYLITGGIGVWWISYFASRSTRELFNAAKRPSPEVPALAYPITDFSVAQAIPPPAVPQPSSPTSWPASPNLPATRTYAYPDQAPLPEIPRTRRPASMTVFAVFLLVGAFFALGESFIPFPIFLFGLLLTGWPAHLTLLAMGALSAYAGYGLLKLKKPAWFATFAILLVALLNSVALLIPSCRDRMIDYTQSLSNKMSMGMPYPSAPLALMKPMFLVSGIFNVLLIAFCLILLLRARWAYESNTANP